MLYGDHVTRETGWGRLGGKSLKNSGYSRTIAARYKYMLTHFRNLWYRVILEIVKEEQNGRATVS